MRSRSLLMAACSILLFTFGCRKTENVKNTTALPGAGVDDISKTSGLQTFAAKGEYGTYQVISKETNKTAQIAKFGLNNYDTANVADYNGSAHQKFRITYAGSGLYKIMNLGSGKVMESINYNGTQVLVQDFDKGLNSQLWAITPVGDKTYKAINKTSGLAVTSNGTGMVRLEAYTGKPTQLWGYNALPAAAYRDDAVVNFFHRKLPSQGSVAFDQGSSIALTWGGNNGKVLWVAEDSFDGIRLKSATNANLMCGFFQYNNSIIIQPSITDWNPDNTPNMTIATSRHGRPRQIVDNQPEADWSWPGVGVEIGNKVYMYNGEGKGLGATNQSLIELTQSAGTLWAVKRTTPVGLSGQTDIGYATGMVKPGDGYVYAYGGKGVFFNATNVYVARFPESDPQDWTFWNGTAWTKTRTSADAAKVGTGQANTTVGYYNGKYIMLIMDLGFFCDPEKHDMYIATATSPTGPFTKPVYVFTVQDKFRGHLMRYYSPQIHPMFENGKRELLITYSVNFNECEPGGNCQNNQMLSEGYQVKGVRVPYSLIGL